MKPHSGTIIAIAIWCGLASSADARTLTFCPDAPPEGFDPALYATQATFDASAQALYDRLVTYERGTTRVKPSLATRWEISEDGLTYTFHLRPGVTFHTTGWFEPTRELNADDVLFTFDRQLNERHPYHDYAGGQWPYATGMSLHALVASIDKVDDATVTFVLTRPEASFLAILAMDFASIVSKEYADVLRAADGMADLDGKPVGTGPFRFLRYDDGDSVDFAVNPNYWGGRPAIDDLRFLVVPDAGVRVRMLTADQCQVIADPDAADIQALKDNADITVMEQERLDVAYLAYNTTQAPFDDPRVRRALNMAIDKQAIVDAVFQGAGTVARSPLPPTMWAYNDDVVDEPYDPAAARTLLAEAGVADLSMKLWAMPRSRQYNPDSRLVADLIKADLAAISVAVDVVSYEWGEYLRRTSAEDRDGAVLFGWVGQTGDPDGFLAPLLGCDAVGASNRAHWCDPAFDDLILQAKAATNEAERSRLYKEAQIVFKQQAPWATLAHSVATVAMRRTVDNYVMDPLGHHQFGDVELVDRPEPVSSVETAD